MNACWLNGLWASWLEELILGCALESPGQHWKMLNLRPYSRPIKQNLWRWDAGMIVFEVLQVIDPHNRMLGNFTEIEVKLSSFAIFRDTTTQLHWLRCADKRLVSLSFPKGGSCLQSGLKNFYFTEDWRHDESQEAVQCSEVMHLSIGKSSMCRSR